jgi:hypothetical protein
MCVGRRGAEGRRPTIGGVIYAYALGDPGNFVDLDGESAAFVLGAIAEIGAAAA